MRTTISLLRCPQQEPGAADVFVNNLAPEVDDATLAEAFANSGRVLGATVSRDQMTGQRCGFLTGSGGPCTRCCVALDCARISSTFHLRHRTRRRGVSRR